MPDTNDLLATLKRACSMSDTDDTAVVFYHQRNAIIAALEAMGWQPIETAPRDGTEFLGYFTNGEMHVVSIDGECHRAMDREAWMMPTHWMPLPPEPVADDQSDKVSRAMGGDSCEKI